ncbi:MAG: hypothetical protein GWP03_01935 [Proteobacteria bacterium]|nr:hypothetical protein [Pseudomonadota bacterium]
MEKLDKFVKKNMILLVLLFLAVGLIMGIYVNPHSLKALKIFIIPSAFLMLWAMMINMDLSKFVNALRFPKELIIGSLMSLVVAPLIMYPIALIVTKDPNIFAGLMLAGLVPPGGFITYWSGILGASLPLAVAIQLVTFIIAIVWVPYGMKFAIGDKINMNISVLVKSILILVVGPFLLAVGTREIILRTKGNKGLKRITPTLHFISSLMAFYLVFAGTSLKALFIYKHPGLMILPIVGVLFYYLLMFPLSYFVSKRIFKLSFEKSIPIVYGSSTKNLSIAMGLAISAFGPLALMGVVAALLIQMPMASIWYKIFEKIAAKRETLEMAIVDEVEESEKELKSKLEEDFKEIEDKLANDISQIEKHLEKTDKKNLRNLQRELERIKSKLEESREGEF